MAATQAPKCERCKTAMRQRVTADRKGKTITVWRCPKCGWAKEPKKER